MPKKSKDKEEEESTSEHGQTKETVAEESLPKRGQTKEIVAEESLPKRGQTKEIVAEESLPKRGQTKETIEEENLDGKELEEVAENESLSPDIEAKKKALLEKAAKLREKIERAETEDLKEQVKAKKKADMLLPLEEYVKSGIYLGTRVVTPDMKPFVYRRRADGLAIFNTDLIDERIKEGIAYISNFNAKDIILVCKRQAGWKAAKLFSEATGIRLFTQKYPAGVLTNTQLPDFFENELTIVSDHWLDKNALNDTLKVKKKVLMICDTNNFSKGTDCFLIGNNKSAKSLGVIFYLLARGFCKAKKITKEIPDLEIWTGEKD
ncbi:MAG: hypothetical protein KKB31_02380 [Nanoarchaeota archaeon]|nr:hypothetical protein [Nanoarchaeota archaeon]